MFKKQFSSSCKHVTQISKEILCQRKILLNVGWYPGIRKVMTPSTVQLQRHLRMLLSNRNSEEQDWNAFVSMHKYGKLHATALQ